MQDDYSIRELVNANDMSNERKWNIAYIRYCGVQRPNVELQYPYPSQDYPDVDSRDDAVNGALKHAWHNLSDAERAVYKKPDKIVYVTRSPDTEAPLFDKPGVFEPPEEISSHAIAKRTPIRLIGT